MNPASFAKAMTQLTIWYAALPDPKPTHYDCSTLTAGTKMGMRQLHGLLLALGWDRREVWSHANNKRVRKTYYAPPPHKVPAPPRGRPSFNINDHLTAEII